MSDIFENRDELIPIRERLFDLIKTTPHLCWLLLTKRADLVAKMLPSDWSPEKYSNVGIGFSAENQKRYDERFPHFAHGFQAAMKFISAEPILEEIIFHGLCDEWDFWDTIIDWVILGGESGNDTGKFQYRPAKGAWFKSMIEQCKSNNVPVFMKQTGTYLAKKYKYKDYAGADPLEWKLENRIQQFPQIFMEL